MAKGSQLSQLKSALSNAGLTHPQQNGKKRKRSQLDEKEKERRAAKLREIQQKMNPFDVKATKLKHDVGGRNIAGMVGKPAQSKQAGMEQRKKTLLKELQDKDRSGGIIDRRFGENDPTMTPEERMLERFTRERQRSSKGVSFNLEDEDELTHYGQSLSKLDDFDNVGLGLDDDEEEDQIDRKTVQRKHFGGFGDEDEDDEDEDGQPERKKTKAEVMAEVIAKSKEHKFLRQQQQEEDENLRHELDQELDSIRSLLYAPNPTSITANTSPTTDDADASHSADAPLSAEKPADKEYDQYVRELAFEARAKPKDRTKTEEEIAREEKETLEKAERARLKRMNGEAGGSSDEEERGKQKRGQRRQRGGDDLEDDFMEDGESSGLGAGLEEMEHGDIGEDEVGSEGSEEESGSDEEEGSDESQAEESDAYEEVGGDEEEEGENEELVKSSTKPKKTQSAPSARDKKELPYTFPCPTTHEEFLEIVEEVNDSDIPTVVKRIRTLHHPSLAEDNKFKLQAFTGVLVDHILHVTSPPAPRFSVLSGLVPHLFALSKAYPTQSAEFFIAKLNLMQKNLRRGLMNGASAPTARTWPGPAELALFRTIGLIWPTSDLSHPVVTPARLVMGAYLSLCRLRCIRDVASGLFLCSLCLEWERLSKRFVPEAIGFLERAVVCMAPQLFRVGGAMERKQAKNLPGWFVVPEAETDAYKTLKLSHKAKKLQPGKPDLTKLLCHGEESEGATVEQAKLDLLKATVGLLGQFGDMYKSLSGFIELYQPVVVLLEGVQLDKLPLDLSAELISTLDTLTRLLKFSQQSRRPLALQAHKPIPIPTYIPRFEQTSSNYLRNRDPDAERNATAKLRAQYKQERKGAIRELRKDARFLATEQQKAQKEKDRAYNERMKKVFGSLEGERAEQKAMEKEKAKEKKRSGKK